MTQTLVQFLNARLEEDERIAKAATPGPWEQSGIGEYGWGVGFSQPGSGVEADDSEQGRADADFIAAHDPSRMLREVNAKQALVELHRNAEHHQCRTGEHDDGYAKWVGECTTLRLLALPYADHSEYEANWKP